MYNLFDAYFSLEIWQYKVKLKKLKQMTNEEIDLHKKIIQLEYLLVVKKMNVITITQIKIT